MLGCATQSRIHINSLRGTCAWVCRNPSLFHRCSKMAEADETTVTFDLGDFFTDNSLNDEEIEQISVPEEVVTGLNDEVEAQNQLLSQKDGDPEDIENDSRFDTLNNNETNEITGASNAKNTHNQTKWAVKVFRGN